MMVRPSVLLALALTAQSLAGAGPVFKLVWTPPQGNLSGFPKTIFEVQPGLLYADSLFTGPTGGTIFSVTTGGAYKLIYGFPNNGVLGSVVQASNGKLYGGFDVGGNSSFYYYSVPTSGVGLQQYPMVSGWQSGVFTTAAPGLLYDVVAGAPNTSNKNAFVSITEGGTIKVLYQFTDTSGYPNPSYNIVYGPGGNIYGIGGQQLGGGGAAFLYQFTPSGAYSTSPLLSQGLGTPYGEALIAASNGKLYATYVLGGTNNTGQILQVTPTGGFQTVGSFPAMPGCPYGCGPGSLMEASDGNLYGTTASTFSNYVYRYSPSTQQVNLIYHLSPTQGYCYPCPMIEGMDGKLYGTALEGGPFPGEGSIFSLDIGLAKPKPVIAGLFPPAGPVGQKVILWGNYLLGPTSVTFNGVPATSFTATSVKSILVTVPAGATTGPVTVTTANGSFTTSAAFTVQ